jgi:hypothetical protein
MGFWVGIWYLNLFKKYIFFGCFLAYMNIRCLQCKGSNPRRNCGREFCPIVAKSEATFRVSKSLTDKDFQGSSPAPFVGRFGYPNVNIGILSPPEIKDNAWEYDAPRHWALHDYSIPQIIDFRSELINSSTKTHVRDQDRILSVAQEVGMASRPVDMEINLENKPKFRLKTDASMAPHGPNAKLVKAEVTSNPKIHTKVDKVVSDTDLLSRNAVLYLYDAGFDENFLSKLLSVGTLGIERNRKLVPTRWSITATDDMLGKDAIKEIRDYPEADCQLYFGSYLGNYYIVMLFPEVWSYELFETYMPNVSWNVTKEVQYTTDYEPYRGRKYYAEHCAGGYYTVRLAVAEHLKRMKRQASVLAIRVITGEYAAPLGVWVTREATRKAMESKPLRFSSRELMLSYAKNLVKNKFGQDVGHIFDNSILLREIKSQRKLNAWF